MSLLALAGADVAASRLTNLTPFYFVRGIGVRQIRIFCGLILFGYLLSHYINHALGNISLDAMNLGSGSTRSFWQSPSWNAAAFIRRSPYMLRSDCGRSISAGTFAGRPPSCCSFLLGLSIPALLCTHLIGERLGITLLRTAADLRTGTLSISGLLGPTSARCRRRCCLIAWIHGCIGVYFWLRLKHVVPGNRTRFTWSRGSRCRRSRCSAPISRGETLGCWRSSPRGAPRFWRRVGIGTAAERDNLIRIRDYFLLFYAGRHRFGVLAEAFAVINERRHGMIRLTPIRIEGIRVPKGLTVLEASFRHHVPHASVCGGKGRFRPVGFGSLSDRFNGLATTLGARIIRSGRWALAPTRPCALPANCGRPRDIEDRPAGTAANAARVSCTVEVGFIPAKNAMW